MTSHAYSFLLERKLSMKPIISSIRELIFRIIRRILLIFEWLFTKAFKAVSSRLPFWKIQPAAKVFNAVNFPHQAASGTLSRGLWINGRVLSKRKSGTSLPKANDSNWTNFKRMTSQWLTREVPYTGITIRVGAEEHKIKSDDEGYFELIVHDVSGSIHLKLDDYPYEANVESVGTSNIPEYVIISDVDDTILETGTDSMAKMLKTTLLSNSLTRELVTEMPAIINGLHAESLHPVFYVTSSPWNLHEFLGRVFNRARLPQGGIFMTNWGLTPKQWFTPSHQKHKGDALNKINSWYPDSKILLFGDDIQKDHRIYAGFIRMHPEKIHSAFIRQAAPRGKRKKVQKIIDKLNKEIGREVMHSVGNADEIKAILAR